MYRVSNVVICSFVYPVNFSLVVGAYFTRLHGTSTFFCSLLRFAAAPPVLCAQVCAQVYMSLYIQVRHFLQS